MFRIYGVCGDNEDRNEWTAGITRSKKKCERFVKKYNEWLMDNDLHKDKNTKASSHYKCLFDPFLVTYNYGAEYFWEEIEDLDVSDGDGLQDDA